MNILKQQIMTEKSSWISGSQALVEGTLKLPDTLEEIVNILEVAGQAEATETNAMDGRIIIDGAARFTVLYIDKKGEISCFDSECRFKHSVDQPSVGADMQVLSMIHMGDISHKLNDSVSLHIRAELEIDVYAARNEEYEILESYRSDKNLEIKEGTEMVPYIKSAKCVKAYTKDELRVPQSMPPAKQVLLTRGYAVAKNIHKEDDKVIVEGDLRIFIVYLSPDKNAPLQYMSETLPFGEIITDAGCSGDSTVFVTISLERLVVDAQLENPDLFEVSAVINICSVCYGEREVFFVQDMYDRKHECNMAKLPVQICQRKQFEPQKKIVRMGIEIPENSPEVARVLYTCAYPEITTVKPEKDRVMLEGIMRFILCYTTADSGIKSLKMSVPFETDAGIPGMARDSQIYCRADAEYAIVEGSGRELEAKCCMEIQAWEMQCRQLEAVADAEIGEELREESPGIVVYFAADGENLWDIAKRFRVSIDAFINTPVDTNQPLNRGTKLILVRN